MDSYKRFSDENYKHWLQVAESLYILRGHIRDFVEKETETYHQCLREKLKDNVCVNNCSLHKLPQKQKKQLPICNQCEKWKDEIIKNHNNARNDIHWNNCQPYLWPTEKWEVAKVYMLRGVKAHNTFDHFDISAILNFMSNCSHFKNIASGQTLTKVINVRNKVMHSPDFRFSKEEMDESINNVKKLAEILEKHAPGLKNISEQIQQFRKILEKCNAELSERTEECKEKSLNLLYNEQRVLRERIELLTQCYEEDQDIDQKLQEELQGMKTFLEQNKDLLENLGPQVNRLNKLQEKVNRHDQDINVLHDRVDRLESIAPDPMFSGDELKFKNHVFEEARKRNMPEPEFTEELEAGGYRGIVNICGRTFKGSQVCRNKKNAHQEVAKQVLDDMSAHPEWKGETTETTPSISSSALPTGTMFYGIVTVVLKNQEIISDLCAREEEATESAYRKLACQFGLTSPEAGNTSPSAVREYFQSCNFPKPLEQLVCQEDKMLCKLQLSGSFTFYDEDGSSKKKQAEHQAAQTALKHLSGILKCGSLSNAEENWKGFLKECLEAVGLQKPDYSFTKNKKNTTQEIEGLTNEKDGLHMTPIKPKDTNDHLQAQDDVSVVQDLPSADTDNVTKCHAAETLVVSSPEMNNQTPKVGSADRIYYGIVTVDLENQEVVSDACAQKDEAIESAYRKLACQFGLSSLKGKTPVLEYFQIHHYPSPQERLIHENDEIFCKLQLTGAFTFFDKVGSSKKKQAEHQAAKVALQHLSGLLNCSSEAEHGKNDKVFLKECLDAHRLKSPVYRCQAQGELPDEGEGPSGVGDELLTSSTTARSKSVCLQPEDIVSQECLATETQDAGSSDKLCKISKTDNTAINALLELFHLKPPSVTIQSASNEMSFCCQVDINLEKFMFQNSTEYTSKKDGIRKTYILLGNALGIRKDDNSASMLVKQEFSQKSLPFPKEVFEGNKWSLHDITYSLVYDGKGSTEAEAKQVALQKALSTLTLLCGFNSLPKGSTVEAMEDQINTLLRTKGQKDLIYSHKPTQYKSSLELVFKDYTMESNCETRKKENLNKLSHRLLGLLAAEPETNSTTSLRNCLDDWFKQKKLTPPVFEKTDEARGSKVTFSVNISCSSPSWEDSMQVAEQKLADELKKRLNYLTD